MRLPVFIKYPLYILLGLAVAFTVFLTYASIKDFDPPEMEEICETSTPDTLRKGVSLNFLSWNIGYCGLGEEMDFFFDGGEMVRASKENTISNMKAIGRFLIHNDSIEFLMLQEVDKNSKRTYNHNQFEHLRELLRYPYNFFADNFKVFFVPSPLMNSMGRVHSGLMSSSRIRPYKVNRMDLPGKYSWPKNLFMLDRCLLVEKFIIADGSSLILVNTHNSAFDGGKLKKQEMAYLKEFVTTEYEKGNYVMVGGDWNQNPPGYSDSLFNRRSDYKKFVLNSVAADFLPSDWTWIYDPSYPTNRSNVTSYDKENSSTTILDFFLASPNIEVVSSKTINLDFKNSDHQPILCTIKLKPYKH